METLIEKLKTLNYKYKIVSDNKIILRLEFNQIIIIELNNDRLVVKDGFNGWNFLTGRWGKDLNFALKYITFLTVGVAIFLLLLNLSYLDKHFGITFGITFFIILSLLWYLYYYIKFLFLKKLIFDIWLNK